MHLLIIVLIWSSILFLQALSDNNSISYELLHYYYVYKMEWDSGVPKTIAVGCAKKFGRMCYFDEFAMHLIEHEWQIVYRPDTKTPVDENPDHTFNPDKSATIALEHNMPKSARYSLSELHTSLTRETPMPQVIAAILKAANTALNAGGVTVEDILAAIDNAQQVKAARSPAVFDVQKASLQNRIPDAAFEHVAVTATGFEWDKTFANIDNAIKAGEFSQETGDAYKEAIRMFSMTFEHDILNTNPKDVMHLNIIKSLATSITQLRRVAPDDSSSSGSSTPRAPSPECGDEFAVSFG